jgi:hypothetical protein
VGRVGDPRLHISQDAGLGHLDLGLFLRQNEVKEIVQPLDTVVASKYVEVVFEDLSRVAEARRRCLVRLRLVTLDSDPQILFNFELIKVGPWVACAAAKKVD